MRVVTPVLYDTVIAAAGLKPKFVRELRPRLDAVSDWDAREFLPITDRSGNTGVLWIDLGKQVRIVPFLLSRGIFDKATGRARPVICDLCCTQQLGTHAARMTVTAPGNTQVNRGLLVCADLACSAHARGQTMASLRSKAQLREGITIEARIERLRSRLGELVASL